MDFSSYQELDINNHIKKFTTDYKELQNNVSAWAKKNLESIFIKFFESAPEIKSIYWSQYIPSFNDGDVCEFSLTDVICSPVEGSKINSPYHYDEYELSESEQADQDIITSVRSSQVTSIETLINNLSSYNILESVYGVNVFIVITRDGTTITEYDCGY